MRTTLWTLCFITLIIMGSGPDAAWGAPADPASALPEPLLSQNQPDSATAPKAEEAASASENAAADRAGTDEAEKDETGKAETGKDEAASPAKDEPEKTEPAENAGDQRNTGADADKENKDAEGEGGSEGEKTETEPEAQSLEQLNQSLQQGKTKTIEIDTGSKKPKFSLLRSMNPEDYHRTEGIWISDSGNGRIIYMKNLEGEDFYQLGLSGAGPGRFLDPEQIWVDIKGAIYVADRGNNRIIKMDDIRGLGWQEMNNSFSGPIGVAFHGKRLYVSDTDNDRILVYENFGDTVPMAEFKDPKIAKPGYMWLDMEGDLYVCCGGTSPQGCIVRIPHDLTVPPSQWVTYKGKGLRGISFSPTHFIQNDNGCYFIDTANERLVRTDNFKGRNSWEIGDYGRGRYQFLEPKGMSQDQQGKIYIADTGNDRIVCIDPQPGGEWKAYDSDEPSYGLRSPKCVFVWSPRPEPEEEEDKDKEKDEENKDK